jgi:membrane-associated phospholipid phosphatase
MPRRRHGLAIVLVLLVARTARAQELPNPYKPGETWPLTLVNGVDFLEPLAPAAAARTGDYGRIVLGTAIPYGLLISSFAIRGTDHDTITEIGRWSWAGVDQKQDNVPLLIGLGAIAAVSAFLPAPAEDAAGYSWRLRLDRISVFGIGIGLQALEVEILKDVFRRPRPDRNTTTSRPSGHASAAFASMAFLSDILRDTFRPQEESDIGLRILEETASAIPYLGGFYMAIERVHGRKHWLTDTLLGGAIGAFTMHMVYAESFTRVETKRGWLESVSLAYVEGRGLAIGFASRF